MQGLCISNRSVIKTSRSKTEKNFRDVMLKKCNVNETFPDLESGIAEVVNTVLENPYWLNGKDVTHIWNISAWDRTKNSVAKC